MLKPKLAAIIEAFNDFGSQAKAEMCVGWRMTGEDISGAQMNFK
jgi:hypothetical protein